MTNEEILKKAIEKAVENGLLVNGVKNKCQIKLVSCNEYLITFSLYENYRKTFDTIRFIFSHSFAKAFWGEKNREIGLDDYVKKWYGTMGAIGNIKEWRYHLQQMVLEKEPLKYLEKFLEEG